MNGWGELVEDEEHGGCMVPIFMLHCEHDEDPEMRPDPISPEQREEVIVHMAAGLLQAYRYFRAQRPVSPGSHRSEPRGNASKVGRNDPCPCGSGKKYKSLRINDKSFGLTGCRVPGRSRATTSFFSFSPAVFDI